MFLRSSKQTAGDKGNYFRFHGLLSFLLICDSGLRRRAPRDRVSERSDLEIDYHLKTGSRPTHAVESPAAEQTV